MTSRAIVDLPEPDSPTTPNERPASMRKSTPPTATRSGRGPNHAARGRRKLFRSPETSSSGALM